MAIRKHTPIPDELKSLLDKFEVYLRTHCKTGKSTSTLYVGMVRRSYPVLGVDPANSAIENYMAGLRRQGKLSNGSISAICTAMERLSEFLGHPLHISRPPKEKTAPTSMSEAEIAVFIHATKNLREKAILALLAYTGLRTNEFCNLLIRDIDVENGLIRVHNEQPCCVSGDCMAILVEYMKERCGNPGELLFITKRHGYEMAPQDIRKLVRVVAKRAGFGRRRIWPFLLRHSLATIMLDRGANILTVRDQLGHEWIESTMAYVHPSKNRSKKTHSNDYRQHAPSYT